MVHAYTELVSVASYCISTCFVIFKPLEICQKNVYFGETTIYIYKEMKRKPGFAAG